MSNSIPLASRQGPGPLTRTRQGVRYGMLLLVLCVLSGCGTTHMLLSDPDHHRPYMGVALDLEVLSTDPPPGAMAALHALYYPFAVPDLPLSFVLDTVTLPYTLSCMLFRDDEHAESAAAGR